ncbi:radical SAM protein [Streptomyces sp. NPDC001137]|uniref:B12-binding domain-containing radical SAM protein n=1 Tax=Streptomyces sp. NPDC001137 TaxID=3154378 RepID=UPI00332E9751
MRILLINMPTPPQLSFGRSTQPLGLAYLAAVCAKEGHEVEILEGNRLRATVDDLIRACLADRYGVIGFSATSPSYPYVAEVTRRYRAAGGEALLVIGGHHVSAIGGRTALEEAPELDVAVMGEGEAAFLELVTRRAHDGDCTTIAGTVARGPAGVRGNPGRSLINDLDSLPLPARHLLPPLTEYAGVRRWPTLDVVPCATLAASRGCPYRCTFCDIQMFYRRESGPMRRVRSPERVVDEMSLIRKDYPDLHFAFMDDLFPYAPNWIRRFTTALEQHGKPGTFSFAGRADQIVRNPELLDLLARAGCSSIEMGIESGSQPVLDRYRKDLDVATNLKAIQLVQRSGIRTIVDFIMFDPWTSLAELRENLAFLRAARTDAGFPTAVYTRLTFYPGTPLYDRWTTEGPVDEDDPQWFRDPAVREVWQALSEFRAACQQGINDEVNTWRRIHRESNSRGDDTVRELAVDSMYTARRLPYQVLEELVTAASAGELRTAGAGILRRAQESIQALARRRGVLPDRPVSADAAREFDALLSS